MTDRHNLSYVKKGFPPFTRPVEFTTFGDWCYFPDTEGAPIAFALE